MAGEIITAETISEAKIQLREIYSSKNHKLEEFGKEQYEAIDKDEREDSDNHLNEERLAAGDAHVVDFAFYKYLENRKIAYRIVLKDRNGIEQEDYFLVTTDLGNL